MCFLSVSFFFFYLYGLLYRNEFIYFVNGFRNMKKCLLEEVIKDLMGDVLAVF